MVPLRGAPCVSVIIAEGLLERTHDFHIGNAFAHGLNLDSGYRSDR